NQLETVQINLKVILIGDLYLESRLNFSSHFIYLRVKQVERDEMERMVEQLITWHIHSKAFSSEYLSMAQRLATAVVTISLQHYVFIPPLSIILRLTKSLFFSSPDNSPDIHSIIRLFTHESIRIIGDSLPEELHSTVYQDLINIIQTILNCNANSLFENHLMMEEGEESTLNLSRLLYSEIETHDTIEGIPYIPVLDFTHLLRAAQNSVFESNSVGIQMNLTMTKWSCLQWQKCSRVLRQSNEHLILAGLPRSGRYQCFRLSAFSTCVQIDHIWSSSPLEWTQSFLASITRILPLLTSSNHHIALLFHADFTPLPSSFLSYLLLFMESPSTNRFLSDELLLSMGESILEEEKSLSVQMQSTSIRLPGERLSKFVSGDSLKDVSVLRSILHSRMHQFIHFVFLVPPIDLHPFHFGTINLFQSPQLIDITRMKESLLPPSSSHSFINHLSSLQSIAYQLISQTRFRPVEIEFADQKETYELFSSFSKEYSTKRQDLKQREEMIEKSMRIIEDLQRIGKVEMSRNREELVAVLSDEEVKRLEIEKRRNEITTKMEIMMNELTNLQSKYKKDEEQLISIENLMEKTLMIPRDNYAKCVSDVVQFPLSEWKKMISVPKPSVGIRFVIKSIDLLLYGDQSDNIQFGKESSKSLKWERTRMSISSLHVESIPHSRIVQLKKYVDNRELKPTRLESDSKLASTLSIWISSVYSYSQIYYSLRDKAKTLFELKEKRELREEETGKMKETMNELLLEEKNLVVVEKELASTISTNKRAFDFMRRSEEIGEAVKKLIPRWKDSLKKTKKNASRLLGDSLIISSFSSLLAHSNHPLRKESLKEWHEYLNGEGIDSSPFSITPSSLLTRTLLSLPTKRRFPLLLFSSHLQPLPILRYIYTHSITIDCSNIDWKSKNTFDRIHKLLYSSLPIIFHSLHSSPPSEYFPLLFPSDGEISYFGRSIELPQDLFLLFVTNSLDGFSKEFIHLLDVLVIDEEPLLEDMDNQMKESDSLDQVTKYIFDLSAEDLLESSEKCDKLVSLANTITFE
ncbi:dhc-4, partial [Pristionchus pacificus]